MLTIEMRLSKAVFPIFFFRILVGTHWSKAIKSTVSIPYQQWKQFLNALPQVLHALPQVLHEWPQVLHALPQVLHALL
jgi:hypothetical protein